MPFCKAPLTPTNSRNGCAMLTSAAKPEQVAHRHAPGDGVRDGYVENDGDAQGGHELHDRVRQAAGQHEPHVRAQVVLVHHVELTVQMVLGVVDLDESWRLEALLGYTGYVAD